MDNINLLSKEAELTYYEEVKDIYLHPNLFSVGNGLLSKGGNLMRQKLVKYFKPQLEDMYKFLQWGSGFVIIIQCGNYQCFILLKEILILLIFPDK